MCPEILTSNILSNVREPLARIDVSTEFDEQISISITRNQLGHFRNLSKKLWLSLKACAIHMVWGKTFCVGQIHKGMMKMENKQFRTMLGAGRGNLLVREWLIYRHKMVYDFSCFTLLWNEWTSWRYIIFQGQVNWSKALYFSYLKGLMRVFSSVHLTIRWVKSWQMIWSNEHFVTILASYYVFIGWFRRHNAIF